MLNNMCFYMDNLINTDLSKIHELLDCPLTAEQITKEIVEQLDTVQDVVRYLVSVFARHQIYLGHGTTNYWQEALEIALATMHLPPPCDKSTLRSKLTVYEKQIIASIACQRIFNRIPTPYLTHRAYFCDHEFYVDNRVIVPRSPIGELIKTGFEPYLQRRPTRVLDMCTGSGCIAIATALYFDGQAEVDAVDISDDALAVANINIEAYSLENLVFPIKSDLFDNLAIGDKYDLIISNPPYVDEYDLKTMPEEYLSEPAIALGSGHDGLDCAKRILAKASDFLNEDGILVMEVGNSEENLVATFANVPFHFIDLKNGGIGVFILTYEQLVEHKAVFEQACAK